MILNEEKIMECAESVTSLSETPCLMTSFGIHDGIVQRGPFFRQLQKQFAFSVLGDLLALQNMNINKLL